jgi:hypothetical protein
MSISYAKLRENLELLQSTCTQDFWSQTAMIKSKNPTMIKSKNPGVALWSQKRRSYSYSLYKFILIHSNPILWGLEVEGWDWIFQLGYAQEIVLFT